MSHETADEMAAYAARKQPFNPNPAARFQYYLAMHGDTSVADPNHDEFVRRYISGSSNRVLDRLHAEHAFRQVQHRWGVVKKTLVYLGCVDQLAMQSLDSASSARKERIKTALDLMRQGYWSPAWQSLYEELYPDSLPPAEEAEAVQADASLVRAAADANNEQVLGVLESLWGVLFAAAYPADETVFGLLIDLYQAAAAHNMDNALDDLRGSRPSAGQATMQRLELELHILGQGHDPAHPGMVEVLDRLYH